MVEKIRTALYGGSFNPIHQGHIALGDYLLQHKLVDECWYVISPQNPLKPDANALDAWDRLQKVSLALKEHEGCIASDLEFGLPLPNFTASTLRFAVEKYPDRDFVLLIGGDNLDVFTQWKDYLFILEHFDIYVYPPPGATNLVPQGWKRVHLLEHAPLIDISSTQLRSKE